MKKILLLGLMFGLTAMGHLPSLEAGGFGKGNDQVFYEGAG